MGIALLAAFLLAACSPAATPSPAPLSDSALQAAIEVNIQNAAGSLTGGISRLRDGRLDIGVRDGVLFIATPATTSAARVCELMAPTTKDRFTGKPLGITRVVVTSPEHEQLAECKP